MDSQFGRPWGQMRTSPRQPEPMPEPRPGVLDAARERIEAGPGGDVDASDRLARTGRIYVPSLKRTVSVWLRLYERVQCGTLGGPLDGQRQPASMRRGDGSGPRRARAEGLPHLPTEVRI